MATRRRSSGTRRRTARRSSARTARRPAASPLLPFGRRPKRKKKGVTIYPGKWLFWGIVALLAAYGAGYLYFTRVLLAPENVRVALGAEVAPDAHGLVVFTGGSRRIDEALDQVAAGFPGPVLITGVHPDVPDAEIIGWLSPERQSQIELDHLARSTRDNVAVTLGWAERKELEAITLVTSFYHVPRSLALLDEAGAPLEIATMPVFPPEVGGEFLVREYSKYLLVRAGLM